MVAGYSLQRLVASAAKIDVYRAQRLDCRRSCLVRIISADAQNREDLLRDAQAAAMIFDPRLPDIFESGTLPNGECFVVEEDIEGQRTLRQQLVEAGAPDLLTSIRIVEQIAETLHILNASGLTHGAVRPENIVLYFSPDGLPKVKLCGIDLGAVISRNTIGNKFLIDSAIDAIRYFAPEQCSGQPLSPQTDIYSLGIVFYELLAGIPPFDAPKATALIEMHRSHRPPEIKIEDFELRMLVTHSLSESLQKQPSFRQSSADLFARQMRHIEQLATHVSTPPPAVAAPAPERTTPPKIDHKIANDHAPSAVHGAIERATHLEVAEGDHSHAQKVEQVGASAFIYAIGEEQFTQQGVQAQTEPVSPEINFRENTLEEVLAGPPAAAEIPLPERTSLAEHRHRLKRLMNRTHPSRPVDNATKDTLMPARGSETLEGSLVALNEAVEVPETANEVQAEADIGPRMIEWLQPDDIPSLDQIEIEPAVKLPSAFGSDFTPPAPTSQHFTPSAGSKATPKMIEWEQGDDDIPSIEELIAARRDEGPGVFNSIQFEPENLKIGEAVRVQEMPGAKVPAERSTETLWYGDNKSGSTEFDYIPTILGDKGGRTSSPPQQDYSSIFSTYDLTHTSRRWPFYRSLFIGIALMVLAALLGLGGNPVWRYLRAPEPNKPVATAASSLPAAPLPARSDRSTDEEPPAPESEPPNSFSNSEPVYEAPEQTIPKRPTTAAFSGELKARRSVQQTSSPVPAAPPERAASTPFSPSTVVITYGGGNVRRGDAPQERSSVGSARAGEPKSSGGTRPRIVQAPPNR